jgi:hypothetical protein
MLPVYIRTIRGHRKEDIIAPISKRRCCVAAFEWGCVGVLLSYCVAGRDSRLGGAMRFDCGFLFTGGISEKDFQAA